MSKHLTESSSIASDRIQGGIAPLLVDVLAVYRIASLLTFRSYTNGRDTIHNGELGPYRIFERFRELIGVKTNYQGFAYWTEQTNEIAKIFICMWCSTFWIGLVYSLLKGKGIAYALALSAGAITLENYVAKLMKWW